MKLLKHLGESDWPKEVWYRLNEEMYTFGLVNGHVEVELTEFVDLDCLRRKSLQYVNVPRTNCPVLLLELSEKELDPEIALPCLVTASSRDAEKTLKTMGKTGKLCFYIVAPYSEDEVRQMTVALDAEMSAERTALPSSDEILHRYETIGGVVRSLFSITRIYQAYLSTVTSSVNENFYGNLKKLRIFNIPEGAKFYVAPCLRFGVEIPRYGAAYREAAPKFFACYPNSPFGSAENYEYRFLSVYASMLVANAAENPSEVKALSTYGLVYQVAESMVRHCLMTVDSGAVVNNKQLTPVVVPEEYDVKKWDWYDDSGYRNLISKRAEAPDIPLCSKQTKFFGMFYEGSVDTLDSNTLYFSSVHNAPVADCFCVNHEKRELFAFQVTSRDMSEREFKSSTIETFLTKLEFDKNKEYKLVLVGVTDWSHRPSKGMKFVVGKGTKTLTEWKSSAFNSTVASRLRSCIVRACFFPSLAKIDVK